MEITLPQICDYGRNLGLDLAAEHRDEEKAHDALSILMEYSPATEFGVAINRLPSEQDDGFDPDAKTLTREDGWNAFHEAFAQGVRDGLKT